MSRQASAPAVVARAIDRVNAAVGRAVAWLALVMVLVQVVLVVLRYVFGIGSIPVQESLVYAHGALFMLASGYALMAGSHVRVDIFYRDARPRRKALIDLLGVLLLLMPVCVLIAVTAWPYVLRSWAVREGSIETGGLQAVYLQKTLILAFAGLLFLQGVSMAIKAVLTLTREPVLPGPPEDAPPEDGLRR
jgi:TRAP-type mannitol/chloroaromatic compound transport system permease small subunit